MGNNLKSVILVILFTMATITVFGQTKLHGGEGAEIMGTVSDSISGQPLEYATIALYRDGNKTPVTGTTTDPVGKFALNNISQGNYKITIGFIGYRTITLKNIEIKQKNDVIDLKQVFIQSESTNMQSVTVTASANPVENRIDKMVFNADKDISSQVGVATDILKKVPQVSVDVDGNVELQGNTNIMFLINGKPSTIFGSNIADVLQSIPASQIQSVEVITNPGAKYDAQGTGGIINIVLKHNEIQGMNGNVSLTTGTINQNGSFNINARKGKFGANAFLNGNARLTTTTPNSFYRTTTDSPTHTNSILKQDGSNEFNRHGSQAGVGFDWSANDKNSVTAALSYNNFGVMSSGQQNQLEQTQDSAGVILSGANYINNVNRSFKQNSLDPSLDYTHNFAKKDQQLEIEASGSFATNLIISGNDLYLQPNDSLTYGTKTSDPAKENEYEIKADYTQPLVKNVNLGLGGKYSGYDIASTANAKLWNAYSGNYLDNANLSNDLDYHQRVYAAYSELDFPVGKSFDAKIGGRYERTQVNAYYANALQKVQKGYNTFVPSVFLLKNIGESQTLKFSYTMRIGRPDYRDLNPYVNASDPKNILTGNPNLKPEVWDRYEASYKNDIGKFGSFIITLFYRQSNGDIQRFVVYHPSIQIGDTTYYDVSLSTRENIGIEENAGSNLYLELHANDKFSLRSNTTVFYRHTVNQVDKGYSSSTVINRYSVNAEYQFSKNFAAEFFVTHRSRHHEAQGYYPAFTVYSIALRKQFWNKKGSLSVSANNIFKNYLDQKTDLYGPGFESNELRSIPFRSVGINFSWKFGDLQPKEEPKQGVIDLPVPQ